MPELPEVEAIRQVLAPVMIGREIDRVTVSRRDVVRGLDGRRRGRLAPASLGEGRRIDGLDRRGKQLLVRFDGGGGLVIRLGMSGRLDLSVGRTRSVPPHRHVVWTFGRMTNDVVRVAFIDPRRFGGVHLVRDERDLQTRLLAGLGPEATEIDGQTLHARLGRTRRAVKVALLDQAVLAGVGNIYADEALFRARIHPETPGSDLDRQASGRLARAIRTILSAAINAGGSTIRDHRLPEGLEGDYRSSHQVYGRSGQPCGGCGGLLEEIRLAARSTTFCPSCQASGSF